MKIKGFTPIFDSLVKKYDTNTALVYGKLWRICDWSPLGLCSMGNDRIAAELGLSEKTIRRKKEILQEDGLIRVVGKAGMTDSISVCHEIVMSMEIADPSDNLSETLVKLSKTADRLTDKDSTKIGKKDILAWEGNPFADYPAAVADLLTAFWECYPKLKVDNKKKWIAQAEVWVSMGLRPKDVHAMCDYAKENGWGVAQPSSVTSAYNMIQSTKEEVNPLNVPVKEYS